MCWFFKRKETKTVPQAREDQRSRADEIRKFVRSTYITPARKKGLAHVSFSAEEVKAGMAAVFAQPSSKSERWQGIRSQSIISAIDAAKFCEFARVKRGKRAEKKGSSDVRWTFEL